MGAPYTIQPEFHLGGLDLVSKEQEVDPSRVRSAKNGVKLITEEYVRRWGYQAHCTNIDNNGGFGLFAYHKLLNDTGATKVELLSVGSKLFRKIDYYLSINYTGTTQGLVELLVNPTAGQASSNHWVLKLYEQDTVVLTQDCKVGFDETPIYSVYDLALAISSVPRFSASVHPSITSGVDESRRRSQITNILGHVSPRADASIDVLDRRHMAELYRNGSPSSSNPLYPAAFLQSTPLTAMVNNVINIPFSITSPVNQPSFAPDPFVGEFSHRNDIDFENVSAVEVDNIILFASKYDEQKKYDGVDCYRSGAPATTIVSAVGAGSGTLAAGTRIYEVTIKQKDAVGNIIEGIESASVSCLTGSTQNVNVTINNILNTTGFNTDCGVVNGNQTSVNIIAVNDGSSGQHTLKADQTAYFYDTISASYVERKILSVTTTNITIAGVAVSVTSGSVISNNLRISIKRSVDTGTLVYEHTEIPNNSFATTQVFNDSLADSTLLTRALYTSPSLIGLEHGLPPKGGYIAIFNNAPVVSGFLTRPFDFDWASPTGSEYYPAQFSDICQSGSNTPITGLTASDRVFWIHKGDDSFLLTGNLFTAQYTVTPRGDAVGCAAHASIVRTDQMVIWLGNTNVYFSANGAAPQVLSDDIAPIFKNIGVDDDHFLRLKRAIGVYDKTNEIYILYLPAESVTGEQRYATTNAQIMVFSLRHKEWYDWDGAWNMAGGAVVVGEDMFWSERRFSSFDSNVHYQMYRRLNDGNAYDYVDHVNEIPFKVIPGWTHGGQPSIYKKFGTIAVYANDPTKTASYPLQVETERNFIAGVVHSSLTITFGSGGPPGSGYGAGAWGAFPWGDPADTQNKARKLKLGTAKSLRPVFTGSGIYTQVVLGGYELEITSPMKFGAIKNIQTD